MPVAIVTDSTASLPAHLAAEHSIHIVPLQVVIGTEAYDEGDPAGASPRDVAQALREFAAVSTSRPSPAAFSAAYSQAVAQGATSIVSVHLSGQLSGTAESAQLAAKRAKVPVAVVDTGQVGMGVGFAVLSAAHAVAAGADSVEAAQSAQRSAAETTSLFYVDTLDYLRRGGRVGAAAAIVGTALAVKPILTVKDGRVVQLEKVRTTSRALDRLEELALEAAGNAPVDVAVAHLDARDRAERLATSLSDELIGLQGREVVLAEVGAVLGAHVGPGMVAVTVSRR